MRPVAAKALIKAPRTTNMIETLVTIVAIMLDQAPPSSINLEKTAVPRKARIPTIKNNDEHVFNIQ